MIRLVFRRLLSLLPVLLLVSVVAFVLATLLPTDPAFLILGDGATPDAVAQVRAQLGLDEPLFVQYWDWLTHAVQGDLGTSYFSSASVMGQLVQRLSATLSLAFGALVVSLVIGVTLGVVSALYRGSFIDRALSVLATIGTATPAFWLGLILMQVFAVQLGWFPATGYVPPSQDLFGWLQSIILPCVALGITASAIFFRQTRSAMIGVLGKEYVRTAIASGHSRSTVVFKYALKNALIPIVTVTSFQMTYLLGGALVVEKVFAVPGMGDLAITAVLKQDVPMLQGIVLVTAVLVLLINLGLDMTYGWLNPKVRLS